MSNLKIVIFGFWGIIIIIFSIATLKLNEVKAKLTRLNNGGKMF